MDKVKRHSKLRIETKIIGRDIIHFNKISSTNTYAKRFLKNKAPEGTVVIADVQTKGRGRKKRIWYSPKGGLWFSVILYPNIEPEYGMNLTMAVSISIAKAIEDLIKVKPTIKWPNDILIKGKKVCGILSEFDIKDNKIDCAIVGIGINVNNEINKKIESKAISLKQVKRFRINKAKLLEYVLENLDENYRFFLSKDFDYIRRKWISYVDNIGKFIKIKEGRRTVEGILVDIDDKGCLILNTEEGRIKILNGDVIF